jgi:hypothetical protein
MADRVNTAVSLMRALRRNRRATSTTRRYNTAAGVRRVENDKSKYSATAAQMVNSRAMILAIANAILCPTTRD